MVDDRIVDYIRTTLASGYSSEQIRQILIQAGNPEQLVDEAFSAFQAQQNKMAQTQPSSLTVQQNDSNGNSQSQNPVQSNEANQTSESTSEQNHEAGAQSHQPSQSSQPPSSSDKSTTQSNSPPTKSKDFLTLISSFFGVKHFNPVYITIVLVLFLFIVPLSLFILIPESGGPDTKAEGSRVDPILQDNFDDDPVTSEPDTSQQVEDEVSEERTTIPTSSKGRCRIFANELALQVAQGAARGLFVSGYASENEINKITWEIGDENVASIMPKYGTYTAVTGKSPGSTNIVVTDTAVGPECTYTIAVTVE
ncbi:MAG: Ig-like domain-containing protein [Nanoarchaeota archaeon]